MSETARPSTADQPIRPDRQPGDRIGPYKLLEPLGEGGMGEVWAAEQTEPVRRRVAVKLIKPGMDNKSVLARFEAERQALALMDHPNIAKVLDAGTTPDGRPYFVMELVKGVPVTEYCDAKKLTTRQRLELFVPICQAVQHAHQKGVIHRDLKPSNILVTEADGKPVPKIIDFGVAKAISQPLTDLTLNTGLGSVVGTPAYMAPEQAGRDALDVDTRADVYSLGVVLYELLAGRPPFDPQELRRAGAEEMMRVVREVDPPRPSTRLSGSADTLSAVAAARGTDPTRLVKLVREDVEWVVMKCLEKDRGRRYETASGLASDISRYLADEPVIARPPSVGYRVRKFVRRNRAGVIAAGLVFGLLAAGVAGTAWGLVRAVDAERAARDEAKAKDDALNEEARQRGLADDRRAQAERERDRALKARARTREALDLMTSDDAIGAVSKQQSLTPQQRAFFEKVIPFYEEFAAEPGEDREARRRVAAAHVRLAELLRQLSNQVRALEVAERAVELYERDAGPGATTDDRVAFARALSVSGTLHLGNDSLATAYRRLRAAEELFGQAADERPGAVELRFEQGRAAADLGHSLGYASPKPEVEAAYRRSVAAFEKLVAAQPGNAKYRARFAEMLASFAFEGPQDPDWDAEGLRLATRGAALARQAAADAPDDPYVHSTRAWCLHYKALFLVSRMPGTKQPMYSKKLPRPNGLPGIADLATVVDASYRESVAAAERAASLAPADLFSRFGLGYITTAYASYLDVVREDENAALAAFDRAIALLRPAPAVPVSSVELSDGYAMALRGRGVLHQRHGRRRQYAEDLRASLPGRSGVRVWSDWLHCGNVLAEIGDAAGAAAEAEALHRAALGSKPSDVEYAAFGARVMSTLSAQAKDPVEADRHAARAVEMLRAVAESGASVRLDGRDFDPLRTRADFREHLGPAAVLAARERAIDRLVSAGQTEQAYLILVEFPRTPIPQLVKLMERAEELRRQLAGRASPARLDLRLGNAYTAIGVSLRDAGQLQESLPWFDKAIATTPPFVVAEPGESARSLSVAYQQRATTLTRLGRHADALRDHEQAVAVASPAFELRSRPGLANALVKVGRFADAVKLVAELAQWHSWKSAEWYDFACIYAVASDKVPGKKQEYADRAMELLGKAVGAGWNNTAHMKKDTDLDPLRDREDFQKLLASIPEPKTPAKARELAPPPRPVPAK